MLSHLAPPFCRRTLIALAAPLVFTAAALSLAFGVLARVDASPLEQPQLPARHAAVTPPGLSEARYFGPFTDDTYGIVAGDINGDGALDLVVVNHLQQSLVYFNDGDGNFFRGAADCAQAPASVSCFGSADASYGAAVGDLNRDGALDIVVANYGQPSVVYLNDGQGGFHYGAVDCAHPPAGTVCFGGNDSTGAVALADLNGDGNLDIVAANNGIASALYFGDGAGHIVLTTTLGTPDFTVGVAVGDVNGDGAPDIVAANNGTQNGVYLNDGTGGFAPLRPFGMYGDATQAVAVGDLNNDGALDIVAARNGQLSAVYLNDGSGNFSIGAGLTFGSANSTQSLVLGDVNGDGTLDIVTGNSGGQNAVYFTDGNGSAAATLAFETGTNATRSVVVADLNGDGTLDLVAGNSFQPNSVYLNDGGGDFPVGVAYQRPVGGNSTNAVAVGDFNTDGALDIVVGNSATNEWKAVYLNDGVGNFLTARTFGATNDNTQSLAVGDFNGDGALDVVAANYSRQSRVYLNNGQGQFVGGNFGELGDTIRSIAVGDLNGDGRLDIAAGYDGALGINKIYVNGGGGQFTSSLTLDSLPRNTKSIALGDFNGDGALDVVAGNDGQPNVIYLKDSAGNFILTQSLGLQTNRTFAVAVSDVNGDGAPDVVTANEGQPGVVYLNDGAGHFPQTAAYLRYFGSGTDRSRSVALGDLNGDGWPDIVAGNFGNQEQDRAYLNDGAANFLQARNFGAYGNNTASVAVGDMNADGALDIVAGNYQQQNMVYLNGLAGGVRSASPLPRAALTWLSPLVNLNFAYGNPALRAMTAPITYTLLDPLGRPANVSAYYSLDGGGQWRPALAASGTFTRNLSTVNLATQSRSASPGRTITDTHTLTSSVSFTETGVISDINVWMSLSHTATQQLVVTLTAPFGQAVKLIDRRGDSNADFGAAIFDDQATRSIATATAPFGGTYRPEQFLSRLNGWAAAGSWILAVSDMTATVTGTLNTWGITVTLNTGVVYTYNWDIAGSGVFGQSDSAVFRLEASPTFTPTAWSVAGPYQHPYASAQTFPFRLRGTQVRVLEGDSPVRDALVYRLAAGQTTGGGLLTDGTGQPFHTDALGYLQGRGQLDPNDRLLALAPVSATASYTIYHTSGAPTATGVSAYTVTPGGVQDLTVSADNPLALFNLNISLEWDAHNDPTYLDQLAFNLQRASEYLYNFTDGQAALGQVTVYQNADEWAYSHVVIQSSNRLRPFALQGGVVETPTDDLQLPNIFYSPGQVTMGATWNRYGNPGQTLGDDWPLILAHELSHYLFFEEDTYLGLDALDRLIPVNTCDGSAMGDIYDKPDNFNFVADLGRWNTRCQNTLAAQTLGRTEWETLRLWYPQLVAPSAVFTGPTSMPFGFTRVSVQDPLTQTNTLADPTFYIDYTGGQISSSGARAYLLRGDDYVISLGSPYGGQNRVLARGAQPDDRLCVFDRALAQFGCRTVAIGADRLQMKSDPNWNPVILFTPVNSRTLTLEVSGLPAGLPLSARLYPDLGPGETPISLTASLSGSLTYTGTFALADPAMSGHIQVWVDEDGTDTNPRREMVVAYSIAGNIDQTRSSVALARLGGGLARGGIGRVRQCNAPTRPAGAPVISPDGQMTFYTPNPVDFAPGTFFAIQAMAGMPSLPPGRTLVGQGYSLVASPGADLPAGSVSIQYLSDEVLLAGADEGDLTLYYFSGGAWVMLDTVRDAYNNLASAASNRPGIYALMASKQYPLYSSGWNLMPYLIQGSRPVSEALASISGAYDLVYSYVLTDTADPWKVFAPGTPAWANDLDALNYGKIYWINVTRPMTAYFATGPAAQTGLAMPPSTVYGVLRDGPGYTAAEGVEVTAWVNGAFCGRTTARQVGDKVVYVLDIFASDGVTPGCGVEGQSVNFKANGNPLPGSLHWSSNRIQTMSLGRLILTYMPLVRR